MNREKQYLVVCCDSKVEDKWGVDYHLLTRTVFDSIEDAEGTIEYWVSGFNKKRENYKIVFCPFVIPLNLYPRTTRKPIQQKG